LPSIRCLTPEQGDTVSADANEDSLGFHVADGAYQVWLGRCRDSVAPGESVAGDGRA
jgi:hypothetical protein